MNLIQEEQILIKDIFNVKVTTKQGQSDSVYLLKDFPQEIRNLGNEVSLVQNSTYFDSLLMERLQVPGTQILYYLEQSLSRAHYALEKPWNKNQLAQKFITYSIEIIKNFIYLSLIEPQIFVDQLEIDQEASKINKKILSISMRLLSHFQRRGFNMEIFEILYSKIEVDVEGDFSQCFLQVLIARQRFQTILDSKAFFYLTVLETICSNTNIRKKFFNLQQLPFLPAQLKKVTGSMIDLQSPFGIFARSSILGNSPGYFHQQIQANKKFQQRMQIEFGKSKFGKQKLKFYNNLQNQFYVRLTEICKLFLKKQTQKQFFQWVYSCIIGNLSKSKLGSRLHGASNANLSHDGLVVNVYVCMLNLCKVILNKNQDKYKKIDPNYFIHNSRMELCKYQKMRKRQNKQKMDIQQDFGTVTQFFFLSLELINVGLVPAQDNFIEYMQLKQKLQKQKMKYPPNHPLMNKINYQIQRTQSKLIRYYILLLDDGLIISTVKLFDMLLFLLPKWLGFDYYNLRDGKLNGPKLSELVYYLPQYFLDSIYKFHLTNFRFKQLYLETISQQHITQIINLTCLLLSDAQLVSNPYIGANFIQLIFYFLQQKKSGIMYQTFKSNTIAHKNLTIVLVKFYCDIAVTGSSHQFYSKFKYRYYTNKILKTLWVHQVYRQQLKKLSKTDVYERFINMLMTDTTYCFDETNQKYDTYKQIQIKKQQGNLTVQEQRSQEQISSQISATLQQSSSNLKLIRDLSQWSPETFLSDTSISTIVPLLNNVLHTFIQPTSFVSNRQLISRFKFQKEIIFSALIQIYVNLDINESLSSQIVKDTRNYQKDYFNKALQKASNQHYTDIATLQNFEQLIRKLLKTINEDDDEQIFGQIPQKYLCSLMNTLLKDPVLLPTSGKIVDKVYIHKHLLIDQRDPFTRASLKFSEVQEKKDLKQEIQAWKQKRLQELKHANKQIKYGNNFNINKMQMTQSNAFKDKVLDYDED